MSQNNPYGQACRADIPYPSVSSESVPSLIDNLVYALYGTITKTVVDRKVVWNIPCDPNDSAELFNIPRETGEGLLCYFIRIFQGNDFYAYNLYGGTAGSLPFQTSIATTSFLPIALSGYALVSNGTQPVWSETVPLAADSQSTQSLYGRLINNVAPLNAQLLAWNSSTSVWEPTTQTAKGSVSGDLSGTLPSPSVVKLRGSSISSSAPSEGNVLTYTGGQWTPVLQTSGAWSASAAYKVGDVVSYLGALYVSLQNSNFNNTPLVGAYWAFGKSNVIDSVALTGVPTAPTASVGTSTTQIATTAFAIANRGDRYLTTSTTFNSIGTGSKTFSVQTGLSYIATQDITVVYDNANHMHGTVTSYDSGTGLVVIDISQTSGSGMYAQWSINVGGLTSINGALLSANNLSDVSSASTSLSNLGGVPLSRSVFTGAGLTGGGSLSANLTLSISTVPVANGGTGATSAATARSNLAVAGTGVSNTFTQPQIVAIADNALAALTVTQTGTGAALVVNDASPDSTPFTISDAGHVGIGVAPDATVCLKVDSTGIKFNDGTVQTSAASGGIPAQVTWFASNGTWTKPAGARSVNVQMLGGGGGGGAGMFGSANSTRNGGGGGAGGGYVNITIPADALGSTEAVTVGVGGAGAVGQYYVGGVISGPNGGYGTASSFFGITASGGQSGSGGIPSTGGSGGAGGLLGNAGGTANGVGGQGGFGAPSNAYSSTLPGGAGGGGGGGINSANTSNTGGAGGRSNALNLPGGVYGGTTPNGTDNANAISYGVCLPGSGGCGAGATANGSGGTGGDGGFPSGGGGGGGAAGVTGYQGSGGRGANGFVVITTYF